MNKNTEQKLQQEQDQEGQEDFTSDSKVLIGYHANCIDGFTAAWACWTGLLETTSVISTNITTLPLEYGDTEQLLLAAKRFDMIYLVDFSIPKEDIVKIFETTKLTIIDHHKTAFEDYGIDLSIYPNIEFMLAGAIIILDARECGASLTWKYFFGEQSELPKLIEYVKDYDLWKFGLDSTIAINRVLRIEPKNLSNWSDIYYSMEHNIEPFTRVGRAINTFHNTIVVDIVSTAEPIQLQNILGLAANCSPHFSDDVGHVLATKSGTFGATWCQIDKNRIKISLRSVNDFDVSSIAKDFGGGGHKNAAGFYIDTSNNNLYYGLNDKYIRQIKTNKDK